MAKPRIVHDSIKVGSDTVEVSHKLAQALRALKPRLSGFSDAFAAIAVRKAELAEPLMDAFSLWNHETSRSFVDFVRAIDPTVPADREGYRGHKTYQACEYLRASVRRRVGAGGNRTQPLRTNALGRMARLMATILGVVKADQHDIVWRALADELAMQPRQITALQRVTEKVEALVTMPSIKRPVDVMVVHMPLDSAAAESKHAAA